MDTSAGAGDQERGAARRRLPLRSVGVLLAAALVGSGLTVGARELSDDDEQVPRPSVGAPNAERATLAPTGMLISLRRPGLMDVPARVGEASPLLVSVDASAPVAALELWAGGELVDRVVPEAERTGRTELLHWTPRVAGDATLVARAVDAEARVGQSNPLRLAVVDGPGVEVAADPVPPPSDAPAESLTARAEAVPALATVLPGLPAALDVMAPPTLAVQVEDCVLEAAVQAAEDTENLTLVSLAGPAQAFQPLVDLGGAAPGDDLSTKVPVSGGPQTLVVAASDGESTAAWSSLVEVVVPDECDGWQGTVKVVDGHLLTGAGEVPAVDEAYLYLLADDSLATAAEPSDAPAEWVRVPTAGFIPKGPTGFDFSLFLPALAGHDLAVEAWGRSGAGPIGEIGAGRLRLDPLIPLDTVVGGPAVALHWVKDPNKSSEQLLTEASLNEPEVLTFRWSTELAGITHILWQVTPTTVPKGFGAYAPTVVAQGVVPADKSTFTIDFTPFPHDLFPDPATAPDYLEEGGTTQASLDGATTYQVMAGAYGVGDPDPESLDFGLLLGLLSPPYEEGQYVVRALPFAGDTYLGPPSNDVVFHTTNNPVAPKGTPAYALDVELVDEPRPPDVFKSSCWQITGYLDQAAYEQKLAADKAAFAGQDLVFIGQHQYVFWDFLWSQLGSNPICAGCYNFGSLHIGLAGGKCSSSSFLGDLFSAFEGFVNLLAGGFAYLKSVVVDAVATLSGCKAVSSAAGGGSSGESICNTLAEVAVNAALISLGIPPTLPDWDQLVAAAKADIAELGASLAAQAGVPCDEAGFAAEVHGEQELTCEGAVAALLDEVVKQVNQAYVDVATSMGFNFPPELRVVPHPDGQVKPATVKITVKPTQYSLAEGGETCSALVATGATWTATPDFGGTLIGKPTPPEVVVKGLPLGTGVQFSSGAYKQIPKKTWSGPVFTAGPLRLPDLTTGPNGGALLPASRTYQLYPPASAQEVSVAAFNAPSGLSQSTYVPKSYAQVPHHTLILQLGAKLDVVAISGCASSSSRSYLLHGFSSPGAAPVEVPK